MIPIRLYRLLFIHITIMLCVIALPSVPSLAQDSLSPDDTIDGRHCDTPTWPEALPGCKGDADTIAVCAPTPAMLTGLQFSLPIMIDTEMDVRSLEIVRWQFRMTFDPDIVDITGLSTQNTLSEAWDVVYQLDTPEQITITGTSSTSLASTGRLVYLEIDVTGAAGTSSDLSFSEFVFNSGDLPVTTRSGRVSVFSDDECPSDQPVTLYLPIIGR